MNALLAPYTSTALAQLMSAMADKGDLESNVSGRGWGVHCTCAGLFAISLFVPKYVRVAGLR